MYVELIDNQTKALLTGTCWHCSDCIDQGRSFQHTHVHGAEFIPADIKCVHDLNLNLAWVLECQSYALTTGTLQIDAQLVRAYIQLACKDPGLNSDWIYINLLQTFYWQL